MVSGGIGDATVRSPKVLAKRFAKLSGNVATDDHLTLSVTSTTFVADRFLRDTPPGSDVTFVGISSAYRF
jgi:hypothetical protein